MPTDELEHELRRAFASAAAGYQHPDQARQRLLQHNYRPSRGHRQASPPPRPLDRWCWA
jgi:hypothetical protein